MTEEKTFSEGTPIRCNRCDARGTVNKEVRAIRENDKVWRIMDFSIPECGHMDTHWIFDCDQVTS